MKKGFRTTMQYLLRYNEESRKWSYLVGVSEVCTRAFKSIYSTSTNRISRAKRLYAQNPKREKPDGRPESWKAVAVKLWLKRFFDLNCEYIPNKNTRHLPDNFTKTEVFKIYVASMTVAREDGHASFSLFLKTWAEGFHNVRIPAVNRFSKCAQCLYYKTLRDKGTSIVDRVPPCRTHT